MKRLPTGKAPVRSHDFLPPDIGPICYHMLCASWLDLLPAMAKQETQQAPKREETSGIKEAEAG